jgi:hypothetical protein
MKDWFQEWLRDPHAGCRKPDKFESYANHYSAVWYSTGFKNPLGEPRYAYQVELSREAFIFTQYTHISEWYMDEPWDAEEYGAFWRTQSVEFDPEDVRGYFYRLVKEDPSLQMPRDPQVTACLFMSLGQAYLDYYGGEEDESETLP